MELELTSLSLYLVELEDALRQEILAKIAEQSFGKANVELVQQSAGQSNQDILGRNLELLKQFENIVSIFNRKKYNKLDYRVVSAGNIQLLECFWVILFLLFHTK